MEELIMPEKQTIERAKRDKQQGKSSSTQAGEFVRGGNPSYQGRQTRCSIDETGDCHRFI
jgi:hypothetical protein